MKVAFIGDLHAHKNSKGEFQTLFERINNECDVFVLCGDLTNFGQIEEAESLATDLIKLQRPILAVLGNHDYHAGQDEELRTILRQAKVQFLDEETFELNDVGFAGVKGFGGGFDMYAVAAFGEEATKAFVSEGMEQCKQLENQLSTLETKYKIVVLHYAPIVATVEGEPSAIHPFLGTSRLAESIDRYSVTAVVHGHAHHGTFKGATPKGTPVYNCARTVLASQGREFFLFEV